jgi:hypothetical protein
LQAERGVLVVKKRVVVGRPLRRGRSSFIVRCERCALCAGISSL